VQAFVAVLSGGYWCRSDEGGNIKKKAARDASLATRHRYGDPWKSLKMRGAPCYHAAGQQQTISEQGFIFHSARKK
jgi:hypothetical protein